MHACMHTYVCIHAVCRTDAPTQLTKLLPIGACVSLQVVLVQLRGAADVEKAQGEWDQTPGLQLRNLTEITIWVYTKSYDTFS